MGSQGEFANSPKGFFIYGLVTTQSSQIARGRALSTKLVAAVRRVLALSATSNTVKMLIALCVFYRVTASKSLMNSKH